MGSVIPSHHQITDFTYRHPRQVQLPLFSSASNSRGLDRPASGTLRQSRKANSSFARSVASVGSRHQKTGLARVTGVLKDVRHLRTALEDAGKRLAALGLAAAVLLQPNAALSEAEVHRFPASSRPDIFAAQRTLLEAWSIVSHNFVDQSFAGRNWDEELGSALMSAYEAPTEDVAYEAITDLLLRLRDPYTRLVRSKDYADFRMSSDGEVQGVGMLIASDNRTGRLVVLSPLEGGPADRAGVKSGDEVVSIDGRSVHGWDGDRAAVFLRGRSGSSVSIRLARRTQQVPGVAGRPDPPLYTTYKQVNLKREKLELSPVYSTALMHDDHKLGYIKLASFSQKAAADMRRHVNKLERTGAEGFILDLRNNPGGLVRAGLDVARIFLDGPTAVFNVTGPTGGEAPSAAQKIILEEGRSETSLPLAVLVNHGSASASEILAGALRDNHRATVLGNRTYGKGKIQSVFELGDGSALFVTVARYKTPLFKDIDQVGIKPDQWCMLSSETPEGLPLDPEAALQLARQVAQDSCVIAAEERLEANLAHPEGLTWQAGTHTWDTTATAVAVKS